MLSVSDYSVNTRMGPRASCDSCQLYRCQKVLDKPPHKATISMFVVSPTLILTMALAFYSPDTTASQPLPRPSRRLPHDFRTEDRTLSYRTA